jgi:hypothetical protein
MKILPPPAAMHEPPPRKNDLPCIQDLSIDDALMAGYYKVAKDLEARKQAGLAKYGTVLQPNNGRNAYMDVYQELLDAIVYMRQALWEMAHAEKPWTTGIVEMTSRYNLLLKMAGEMSKLVT